MSVVAKRLDGLIKMAMALGMEVGLGPGAFVFGGDPATQKQKVHPLPPSYFQTAGWMKKPLGTEVDLGPGHIVLDGLPALCETGTAAPSFRPVSIVATVARLSYC